eukprot:CAMPEP_0119104288 /NCGR_PEP_ID=MMETSP1180-20130426/2530_1 /TAXON_ID=3052 ORGANISM="Chlamydomonas cf sp, Strain CCMP681" /NCGR_SAMPLE_ID=MMETSP1180 /ASSEMBLY_ACC=CAM_ASM_000741 /LENGTH=250 /DNA_ID=CAMNT_0007088993 /DNA_START=270 /DNA_END=1022 /DNA_ORIENTATION=-
MDTAPHSAPVIHSAAVTPSAAPPQGPPAHLLRIKSNFCRICGSRMQLIMLQPAGVASDSEWRHVCINTAECGAVDYHNPRTVVGCIVEHEGKVLLCRRAIEPCRGKWTVPAGYQELAESTAQGAIRETREEATAEVVIDAPFATFDIPSIGQTYMLFRARLAPPFTHAKGVESLETALFAPEDIPWKDLAFSSISLSLKYYLEDKAAGQWRIHFGVIDKAPGAGPNDPATFKVSNLLQLQVSHAVQSHPQ